MAPMEPTNAPTISEVEPGEEYGVPPELEPRFEDFFELHYVRLFRALWLIARDRAEAEDVMQDAFLRLWERWDRVSALEDPAGYLYRTAMNVLRSRRRRALVAIRRAVIEPSARDELEAVESWDVVRRALASLTPRQRAVGFARARAAGGGPGGGRGGGGWPGGARATRRRAQTRGGPPGENPPPP